MQYDQVLNSGSKFTQQLNAMTSVVIMYFLYIHGGLTLTMLKLLDIPMGEKVREGEQALEAAGHDDGDGRGEGGGKGSEGMAQKKDYDIACGVAMQIHKRVLVPCLTNKYRRNSSDDEVEKEKQEGAEESSETAWTWKCWKAPAATVTSEAKDDYASIE
jgi:hypothetical protein